MLGVLQHKTKLERNNVFNYAIDIRLNVTSANKVGCPSEKISIVEGAEVHFSLAMKKRGQIIQMGGGKQPHCKINT